MRKILSLLMVMLASIALVFADEPVQIASGTFDGKNSNYTEGWTTTGTGVSRSDCIIIGADENITSPEVDLSQYESISVAIKARRYGTLSGSKAEIAVTFDGEAIGNAVASGTSATTALDVINYEVGDLSTGNFVVTCSNATSAGSTHGAGINSIVITGVLKSQQGGGEDPQPTTRTIYLNGGGASLWNQADAVFFVHAWGGTDVDVLMTQVEGDVYSADIPSDNTSLLFVRMAPGSEAINWDTKWNQSTDQTIPAEKNLFTMTDWSNGTWSVYGETPEPPTPVEAAYYLVGTMNSWQAAEAYKFAAAETEGEYLLHTTLAVGDEIKVIKIEGETTTWYPAEGGNYVVDAAHAGEKDIYFRPAGNEAWADFGGYIWMGENQPAPVADFTQPFVLKFNGTGESGKDASAAFAADVAAIFDAASAPYVESVETATKVYAGRPIADDNSSVKFGTSSAQGTLAFTLAQAIEVDSIIVNATQYGNNAAKITVNGTEFDLTAGNKVPQDSKITPEEAVSVITIAQSGTERIYLRNVRVYPKTQGGDPVVVPAKFYVTGNAALVGQDKEWNPSAIKSMADTLELNLEADIDYVLKVTVNGTWEGENNVKGYNELTEKTEGLLDLSDDHNIGFKLNEAGVVKVIYKAAAEEQPEVFKLIGNFYVAPVAKYYLIGDSAFVVDAGATADKAWTPDAIPSFKDTTVLNLKAGQDYIMRLSLNGTWENHRDFRHLTDTAAGLIELPDEFGNHSIGFSLAEAGDVTIIYIPATNEQPEVFKLIGDFYVAPAPDPTVAVMGTMNNWAAEIPFVLSDDKTYASLTVENIGADEYEFKFIINGEWRSNGYRFHREFTGAAGITENNKANMVFVADQDGEYTFYWYFANDSAAIVYPEYIEPAKEYYAKYAPAWEWTKLTEAEGLWLTDTIVYGGIGININDAAADENNMFYSNTVEEEGVRPIAGPEIDKGDTVYFSFNPADSVLTAVMVGKYVAPVVVPTVSVFGSMTRPAWEVEIPFELSEDKTYATLYNDNIKPGEYTFKLQVNGDWRSNGYRYHRDFPGAAGITGNADADMTFVADQEGEYTFTWFFANDSLAITYPELPFACDWDNIAWLDGSNEQIKVCKESEAVSVINVQKPGWAAEKGIYMTFPSAAWGAISLEEGSYVTEGAGLLVYLSALNQLYNEISIVCQDVEYIINVYNAANAPKPAFYLVGNFNEWTAAEAYKFALNPNNDAEYVLTATLAENDSLKVIRVMEGEETVWYPAEAENYVVDAAHAGEKDIYFRPDYQGGEDWYAQCIYVAENAPQGCDWDHIDFIGSAVPELADQFKLCKEGQYPSVINIQNSFGTEAGIYVTFPSAAFGEISMTEGTYAIQGAGMLLYCSAFTDVETEVSIVCDGNPIIFTVYNAEGSAPVVDPTVSVKGSMNDWAEEIPFVLSDDKTYASLTVENISAGNYEFKFIINGEWRSNGYRYHRGFPGAAGITKNNEANMTFEADIDGEYTFYWYFANDSAAIVYPAKPEPVLANGYYLVGSMNEWTPAAENLFAVNPDNDAEYQLAINLDVNTEIKVVYVENDAIVTWYPAEGENYVIDDHHNGATTVYFRPDGQGGEDWYNGVIYVVPTSTVDITNVDANAPAVKILRDGQLLIIKGEKMYNVMGQTIK